MSERIAIVIDDTFKIQIIFNKKENLTGVTQNLACTHQNKIVGFQTTMFSGRLSKEALKILADHKVNMT